MIPIRRSVASALVARWDAANFLRELRAANLREYERQRMAALIAEYLARPLRKVA